MFDEDDFFINDDELALDNQQDIVSSESIKLLELITKTANSAIENFKYKEKSDAMANIKLMSSYLSSLIDFLEADTDGVSDEEICQMAAEISKVTTELTLSNIDNILGKVEDTQSQEENNLDENDGLDF